MSKELSTEESLAKHYKDWDKIKENNHIHDIVSAFIAGKEVEIHYSNTSQPLTPASITIANLIQNPHKFKIKQEDKYKPYTFDDYKEFEKEWFKWTRDVKVFKIISFNNTDVHSDDECISYETLFKNYTKLDGTPAGIKL